MIDEKAKKKNRKIFDDLMRKEVGDRVDWDNSLDADYKAVIRLFYAYGKDRTLEQFIMDLLGD